MACELYHLPFLPIEQYQPSSTALDGYDLAYLRHFALVPLDRFGGLVTVVMPALVPSEVLDGLRTAQNGRVLPVVGSVVSNRRWLEERFTSKPPAAPAAPAAARAASAPSAKPAAPTRPPLPTPAPQAPALNLDEGDWGTLFDAGDEAVQLGLKKPR